MRERITWSPAEAAPPRAAVLALQGIPAGATVPGHITALVDRAMAIYAETAEPRAVLARVSAAEFAAVYDGDGRNAAETPLESIYPKADSLALAVATIGPRVPDTVRTLFRRHELALGAMLDSVGSAAADGLADLAGRVAMPPPAGAAGTWRVLAYSPGYCGWHVSGQRALFRLLRPEAIGVSLNESCLMQPLKSVSAVLVGGPRDIHRFHPTYPFCDECVEKQCRDRMASALKPCTQGDGR